jgi:hypothetical protein
MGGKLLCRGSLDDFARHAVGVQVAFEPPNARHLRLAEHRPGDGVKSKGSGGEGARQDRVDECDHSPVDGGMREDVDAVPVSGRAQQGPLDPTDNRLTKVGSFSRLTFRRSPPIVCGGLAV